MSNQTHRVERIAEVCRRTGTPRSSLYLMIKQGRFPKPFKLSERSIGWTSQEIDDWITARSASRPEAANDA
jgi:prophage regulatory protein